MMRYILYDFNNKLDLIPYSSEAAKYYNEFADHYFYIFDDDAYGLLRTLAKKAVVRDKVIAPFYKKQDIFGLREVYNLMKSKRLNVAMTFQGFKREYEYMIWERIYAN